MNTPRERLYYWNGRLGHSAFPVVEPKMEIPAKWLDHFVNLSGQLC
jgi:hypothetical protein